MNAKAISFSLTLLFTSALAAWAQDETIDFSSQSFNNGEAVDEVTGSGCVVEFSIGSNTHGACPKYYTNGESVRVYVNNTMTVTASDAAKNIVEIHIVFGSGDGNNVINVEDGSYADGIWTGAANSVCFTVEGKNGHRRIQKLEITYKSSVDAPVITSYSGSTTFQNTVNVGIQAEENATIRYTTNGDTPDETSTQYINSLTFNQTTLLQAIAIKDGKKSNVASMLFVKDVGLWSGMGTKSNPFIIDSQETLNQLADRVNAGETYKWTYFKMTADICYSYNSAWDDETSTETNFDIIGIYGKEFSGIFDGEGHTISGIRYYNPNKYFVGLFGNLSSATVRNLTLADTRITAEDRSGCIAGYVSFGVIENCHVLANVCLHDKSNSSDHGGIVGNNGGTIRGCTCSASLSIDSDKTGGPYGGIVGRNSGPIINCLVIGSVLPDASHIASWAQKPLGAIAGSNQQSVTASLFYDCMFGNSTADKGLGDNSISAAVEGALSAHVITFDVGRLTILFDGAEPNPDVVEAYDAGLAYQGKFYAAENKVVTFSFSVPDGLIINNVSASCGTLTETLTPNTDGRYTLSMPSEDVFITATIGTVSGTITLFDKEDNSTILVDNDGVTADVTLSGRTLYKDGSWNTLCLPFSLSSLEGTPLEGATVKSLESTAFTNGTLTLNFTDDAENLTQIEAGVPYIVKWANGDPVTDPTFENVTISNTMSPVTTAEVIFTGLYSPLTVGKEKPTENTSLGTSTEEDYSDRTVLYLGSSNTLYYPTEAMTIGAFRAFFQLQGDLSTGDPVGPSSIRAFQLNFGDETMGISNIIAPELDADEWYSLSGSRLSNVPTKRGIYIYKGRKVFIPLP